MNQPFVFGWHNNQLYLQAYNVLEDDKRDWSKAQPKLLSKTLTKRIQTELATRKEAVTGRGWHRSPGIRMALPCPCRRATRALRR